VVGAGNATEKLSDDQVVTVDGDTGTVTPAGKPAFADSSRSRRTTDHAARRE
jgi:phosphoenolpyruvate-protein kinase (PTS system EI component)